MWLLRGRALWWLWLETHTSSSRFWGKIIKRYFTMYTGQRMASVVGVCSWPWLLQRLPLSQAGHRAWARARAALQVTLSGVNKKLFTWYNPTSLEFNYDTQFQRFLVWQTLIGVADSNGPSGIVLIYTEFDNWTKCGQNLPLSFRLAIKLSYRVFFL